MNQLAKIDNYEMMLNDKKRSTMRVGHLEEFLLSKYPATQAEEWDRTGLLVGDRLSFITRVALALDPTIEALRAAKNAGANVLVTHHPIYRSGGAEGFVACEPTSVLTPGNVVYEAATLGISCMNFHTALDVSKEAHSTLPSLLHLKRCKHKVLVGKKIKKSDTLCPVLDSKKLGYGQFVEFDDDMTIAELASRCVSVFGRNPRVWGDMHKKPKLGVCATGSCGDLIERAQQYGVDVVICGEARYHDALAGAQKGVSVIELGHDLSEIPLAALLANDVSSAGLSKSQIILLDQSHNWQYPDAVRI